MPSEGRLLDDGHPGAYLVCRVQTTLCALRLEHVRETMRPLPIEVVSAAPSCVRGMAIIRGAPVPVVDIGWLFGRETRPTRFVTVIAGQRQVALAVDEVLGVRSVPAESLNALPPLLRDANAENVAAVGMLDTELLLVLDGARLLPEESWLALGVEPVTA